MKFSKMCLFHKFSKWEVITELHYTLYSWFDSNKAIAWKTEEQQTRSCIVCNYTQKRTIHYHRA